MTPLSHLTLPQRVQQAGDALFPKGCRAVVAVSGGADSVALLHLLLAGAILTPEQMVVAHFDHNLRPDSTADVDFTRQQAAACQVRFVQAVWTEQPRTGNRHEAARHARYAFLIDAARACHASRVVTAHHLDDQVETLMARLLRGSGLHGVAAMARMRPLTPEIALVRPLLEVRRRELIDWLQTQKITWRNDPSNQDLRYQRNRIRHVVLPAMTEALTLDPAPALGRALTHLAQADGALEWSVRHHWKDLDLKISREPLAISGSQAALHQLPAELARRVLIRCHRHLTRAVHPPGEEAMQQCLDLLYSSRRRWEKVVRGMRVVRLGSRILCIPFSGAAREQPWDPSAWGMWETVEFSVSLSYDGV
ncbi:MAG: tRNA lysidine(34) synthetase TilS [Magnetococcales bacterium]|nr:tRNA lysidine(34) synthetase TilS [Magnetococcales bacterium]NGZ05804.1 tRNA lysidine(34) synthetase TilS [Magnetococcales bacterium]